MSRKMTFIGLLLVLLCMILDIAKVVVSESDEDSLPYFEPLSSIHLRHTIVKRSITDDTIYRRELEFDTLNRHFHLKLSNRKPVVANGFRVTAIDKDGKERDATPELNNFYTGYDTSDPEGSSVSLYVEDGEVITGSIEFPDEVYNIEPSWRHIKKPHNYSMMAYRRSDVNMQKDFGKQYCEGIRVEESYKENHEEHEEMIQDFEPSDVHRMKRQVFSNVVSTPARNTCPLYLVADYRFFQSMGESSIQKTTSYMLNLVDRIDNIYRKTNFSYGYVGMGFEVKDIRIHEHASSVAGHGAHYNQAKLEWDTKELLEVFSRNKNFRNFCLAHLFTHIPFSNGVLGLAYIGSPRTYSVGGVCSPVYYKNGKQLYLNTGWSSSVNRSNRSLLTDEALLVTTHEFGHNWGSEHDPDTAECSPGSFKGGKYIMYTYSVSGYDQNNKMFSNCSRRNMGAVLHSKAPQCFTAPSGSFCGNFRIESGEECDAGPVGSQGNDRCCDKYCQLRSKAVCSDSNHECCWGCRYQASTEVCHIEQLDSCEGEQRCTGKNATCPPPPHKTDNSSCLNRGKCKDGLCTPFCESQKLHSCVCDNVTESCYWCCRDSPIGKCKPHPNNYFVPNGTYCVAGICNGQGTCEKQTEDLIERIWEIIEQITPDTLVEFMRANIVGTVLIFSLIIWIPASCIVCHLDRKKSREDEKQREWLRHDFQPLLRDLNQSLVLDDSQSHRSVVIRRAEGVRMRRGYHHVNIPRDMIRGEARSTFI